MKKIAIVFDVFDHAERPYLSALRNQLKSDKSDIAFYSCSREKGHSTEYSSLYYSTKWDAVKRLLLFFYKWPKETIKNVVFSRNDGGLKSRLRGWAIYGPLIVYSPDVVHLTQSGLYTRFENILKENRFIVSFRGGDIAVSPWIDPDWKRTLVDRVFGSAGCLHFVSHYLQIEAQKIGGDFENSMVIYPGVDTSFFSRPVSSNFVENKKINIVTTARLSWQKGHRYAFQAIRILKDKGYSVQYNLLGGGYSYNELMYWRRLLSIEENVNIHKGYLTPVEIRDGLLDADIYIHPSITEAISVAIMEAMAMELPVVASNVGGIPELVLDGETGILVPPADPQALASAILELITDHKKCRQMKSAARSRIVNHFSLDMELEQWKELYGSF